MTSRIKFTLVELLVVIAIVMLLISILMPALKKAKEYASASSCLGNLKQNALCVNLYIEDYDSWYPWTTTPARSLLNLYIQGVPQIFNCPSNKATLVYPYSWTAGVKSGYLWSYRMFRGASADDSCPVSAKRLKNLSSAPLVADADWIIEQAPYYWQTSYIYFSWAPAGDIHNAMRHSNAPNAAFADGRAAWTPVSIYKNEIYRKGDVNDKMYHLTE